MNSAGDFSFETTSDLEKAFDTAATTEPEVKTAAADKDLAKLVKGMSSNLKSSGCDIDHIVEKQMGGTSIPSNLQLLLEPGRTRTRPPSVPTLVFLVEQIRDPKMRGPGVKARLQLVLRVGHGAGGTDDAKLQPGDAAPEQEDQGFRRAVKSARQKASPSRSRRAAWARRSPSGTRATPIESMAKRIVPGMRLNTYVRAAPGAKEQVSTIEGELDARSRSPAPASAKVILTPVPAAGSPHASTVGAGAGGAAAEANAVSSRHPRPQARQEGQQQDRLLCSPYLSPGSSLGTHRREGRLWGEGVLKATVPIFGNLMIQYGPDPRWSPRPGEVEVARPPAPLHQAASSRSSSLRA